MTANIHGEREMRESDTIGMRFTGTEGDDQADPDNTPKIS